MDLFFLPYLIIGIFSGMASGIFGIGGGMIIVPFMLSLGLSSHHAIAISVVQMIFASVFGSYLNYKKKNLILKDGLLIGLGGFIGAMFSGVLLTYFSDITLTSIFLCVSIVFFLKFAFNQKSNIKDVNHSKILKNLILIICGIFTGIFAISLGIGGGLLITPILAYFLGYDTKKVVPLSLFFVIFASISGISSFVYNDIINKEILQIGILVGISSMFGVFLGIKIMEKINLKYHRIALLSIYLLSISMTMISLLKKLNLF
ncbi:sulfite exporter TauE/SafE family protein [Campylobacter volucris]|uniref:sulfite exporter TauE/SafE family protein n=1 Tax=Campylobacter volucris TaxID=1031542 RepID=UPI00189F9DF1|nr:sulfite exporter TauE/SafE family protein [Campylobacter volucris]MBF7048801.1 sulfite exporter TauE/SafE family protein [Campylobacter volucris]MBF7059518.1 sulfite exporter TauE/SafE family protein [Campylobacter volucris]